MSNLKATEEQMEHIRTNILGDVFSRLAYAWSEELDLESVECDDRIYIDGDVTFDQMEEIVNYLKNK